MTNFRKHTLSTGKEIYAGKDENTNDELVYQSKPMEILLHTVEPGSPFVNIGENPSKTEMKEAAIFCASRSQHWRDTRKDIPVNWFYKKNTTKNKKDKAGSWHTKQEGKIIAKKGEILSLISKQPENNN